MKVLHVVESYLPSTQNWAYPQISAVPDIETAVYCGSLSNSENFPPTGRPFYNENPWSGRKPWVVRALRAALRRIGAFRLLALARTALWRPAVVHAHFGTVGWDALRIKRLLHAPLITAFYGFEAWALPATLPHWIERYRALFHEGDVFLVEGPVMQRRLIDIGCPAAKIRIRHLGIDVERLAFVAPDFKRGLRIIMVGRFVEKKGLVDGLAACRLAVQERIPLEVTIVGDAVPDDRAGQSIKDALLALALTPELAGHVRFTGSLSPPAMLAELGRHNIILCPSRHANNGDAEGGMPFVLAEAMAMGIIGVGSDHCDMRELIVDGNTGFLFKEGDVVTLARILGAVAGERGGLQEMAMAARRHIEQNFDLSRQLEALRDIYIECAASATKVKMKHRAA